MRGGAGATIAVGSAASDLLESVEIKTMAKVLRRKGSLGRRHRSCRSFGLIPFWWRSFADRSLPVMLGLGKSRHLRGQGWVTQRQQVQGWEAGRVGILPRMLRNGGFAKIRSIGKSARGFGRLGL